jgi:hypothetical protein
MHEDGRSCIPAMLVAKMSFRTPARDSQAQRHTSLSDGSRISCCHNKIYASDGYLSVMT